MRANPRLQAPFAWSHWSPRVELSRQRRLCLARRSLEAARCHFDLLRDLSRVDHRLEDDGDLRDGAGDLADGPHGRHAEGGVVRLDVELTEVDLDEAITVVAKDLASDSQGRIDLSRVAQVWA